MQANYLAIKSPTRHLHFVLAEFLALWREEYFSERGFLKKFRRYWMRVVENYFESIRYHCCKKNAAVDLTRFELTPYESSGGAVATLREYGVARLADIDVGQLPFVIINHSNARPSAQHTVEQNQACVFAEKQGFHEIAARYLNETECYFLAKAWRLNHRPEAQVNVGSAEWHRDRDGSKVIKFFVYLSDVINKDGEHEYAPGTHIIKELRFVPQIRFSDEEVKQAYQTLVIKGMRGTCFVEDTTGLHKGNIPINSNRDLLCFAYFCGPVFWDINTRKLTLPHSCNE